MCRERHRLAAPLTTTPRSRSASLASATFAARAAPSLSAGSFTAAKLADVRALPLTRLASLAPLPLALTATSLDATSARLARAPSPSAVPFAATPASAASRAHHSPET